MRKGEGKKNAHKDAHDCWVRIVYSQVPRRQFPLVPELDDKLIALFPKNAMTDAGSGNGERELIFNVSCSRAKQLGLEATKLLTSYPGVRTELVGYVR